MKYCLVKLLYNYVNISFTYHTDCIISIGDIVSVELKNNIYWGIIVEISYFKTSFETKPILHIIYLNNLYHKFIEFLASYYILKKELLYKKIISQLLQINKAPIIDDLIIKIKKKNILNEEQQLIFNKIIINYENNIKSPNLLHGITGSGKSHIYIALIEYFLNKNLSIILLLPNAHLAHTICNMIKEYINPELCYENHSQSGILSRKKLWNAIIENKNILICGVHLPIFLPITNLGGIIIDEEHDTGYIHQRHPYINSKEAALIRGQIENLFILLGSATPSVTSFYQVKCKKYIYFYLSGRYYTTLLPKIKVITLEKKKKISYLSLYAEEKIKDTLNKNEQVLIYLNKKGLYKYAQCNGCKKILICENCTLVLTIFAHNLAKCGRCQYKKFISSICHNCQSKNEIKVIGIGLDKIYNIAKEIFPKANIIQLDGDILKKKKIAEDLINQINKNECDIILGTGVITKGYNFHKISLVVILNVDQNFFIPHFTMTEETIQSVIQVAGRAGRKNERGSVIIQSYNDMSNLENYFEEKNYLNFIEYELSFRKLFLLPPYVKIALLIGKFNSTTEALDIMNKIYYILKKNLKNIEKQDKIFIEEPVASIIEKIKKKYYYQIKIKTCQYKYITEIIRKIILKYNTPHNQIYYIPNPILSCYE